MRFRAEQHLRRPEEFQHVRSQGDRFECGPFTIWHYRRPPTYGPATGIRVGVVASKASVGMAVERNRAKRRLRALFRENQNHIPENTDLILIARRSLNRLEYAALERKFLFACRKLFPRSSNHA